MPLITKLSLVLGEGTFLHNILIGNLIGMLGPLNLTTKQLVISSTILAIYFPCIATFAVLIKELGLKDTLRSLAIMLFVALLVGTLLNVIL